MPTRISDVSPCGPWFLIANATYRLLERITVPGAVSVLTHPTFVHFLYSLVRTSTVVTSAPLEGCDSVRLLPQMLLCVEIVFSAGIQRKATIRCCHAYCVSIAMVSGRRRVKQS